MVYKKLTIYSTGTYLQSIKCNINGRKQYRWVAIGFEDESFLNGHAINPNTYSDNGNNMVNKFGEN